MSQGNGTMGTAPALYRDGRGRHDGQEDLRHARLHAADGAAGLQGVQGDGLLRRARSRRHAPLRPAPLRRARPAALPARDLRGAGGQRHRAGGVVPLAADEVPLRLHRRGHRLRRLRRAAADLLPSQAAPRRVVREAPPRRRHHRRARRGGPGRLPRRPPAHPSRLRDRRGHRGGPRLGAAPPPRLPPEAEHLARDDALRDGEGPRVRRLRVQCRPRTDPAPAGPARPRRGRPSRPHPADHGRHPPRYGPPPLRGGLRPPGDLRPAPRPGRAHPRPAAARRGTAPAALRRAPALLPHRRPARDR